MKLKIIYIVLTFILILSSPGCEKPSVKTDEKNISNSKEQSIKQSLYRGLYEYKNEKHTIKDCSTGRISILDPQGETIEIKKYSDKYAVSDSSSSVYIEFEGFASVGSIDKSTKQDTLIIPTRIILLDKNRKCN